MLKHIFKASFPYDKWIRDLKKTNIPIIETKRGAVIKNIRYLPLEFSSDIGEYMAHICPYNSYLAEAMIIEIPQQSSSKGHRHIYAEEIIVLSGSGRTIFKENEKIREEVEWAEGSYLFIPFNLWHQHFNAGDKPARFLVVTPAPLLINIFRNRKVLYNFYCPFIKKGKNLDYIKKININKNFLRSCFIKDITKIQLPRSDFVGKDYHYLQFRGSILRNIFHSTHIGELSSGTYTKAHKHGGEVFMYILSGKGYILLGKNGGFKFREKISLEKDDLVNLPPWQYHQVFSISDTPLRFVAFKGALSFTGILSLTELPYSKEDKEIKQIFAEEINAHKTQL